MYKKQNVYIIISIVLSSLIMTFIDAVANPVYAAKSIFKLILFLVVPMIYFVTNKAEIKHFKNLFTTDKTTMLKSFGIGVLIYAVILAGYFLTREFIDYSEVTDGLTKSHGVNKGNFVYVSLYISLMNSFLEEFFFRGFGFITLKHHKSRRFAYIFSAGMFAIYHTGMLAVMFDLWVLPILFAGLFAGGIIFNYLNETSESIYTSWAVHMFANFSINTVGFMLFGII